jgi:hypothetical protein
MTATALLRAQIVNRLEQQAAVPPETAEHAAALQQQDEMLLWFWFSAPLVRQTFLRCTGQLVSRRTS